jgi:hypothetical protein
LNDSTLKFCRGVVEAADALGAGALVDFVDASLALTVPTISILWFACGFRFSVGFTVRARIVFEGAFPAVAVAPWGVDEGPSALAEAPPELTSAFSSVQLSAVAPGLRHPV